MKTYLIICLIFSLINSLLSTPAGSPSTTSVQNHRNINLLPAKNDCGKNTLVDKLFGGKRTSIYEFPWVALLRYKKRGQRVNTLCAGVLINEKYILTAAHCINTPNVGVVTDVRLGENDLSTEEDCDVYPDGDNICAPKPIEYEVEEIIAHSQYDTKVKQNDIALIRLKENVKYSSFIKPVCLPLNGEETEKDKILTASGWGKTEKADRSNIKLKVNLPVVSKTMCKVVYSAIAPITDSQLCAGAERGFDACKGDSGGPLMGTYPNTDVHYLEGIVSFGLPTCAQGRVPGVYTRVTKYMEWILDNMRP